VLCAPADTQSDFDIVEGEEGQFRWKGDATRGEATLWRKQLGAQHDDEQRGEEARAAATTDLAIVARLGCRLYLSRLHLRTIVTVQLCAGLRLRHRLRRRYRCSANNTTHTQ
jgi:hypothetical protein